MVLSIISLFLIAMWVLFIFAVFSENNYFIFIASAGMILLAVYIMVNGLQGIDNFVTKGVALLHIGIGMIGLFAPLEEALSED